MKIEDLKEGMEVAIHPKTDLWMRGVRYATITKVGRKIVTVQAYINNRTYGITPDLIFEVMEASRGTSEISRG
jgi:hypothetical protein